MAALNDLKCSRLLYGNACPEIRPEVDDEDDCDDDRHTAVQPPPAPTWKGGFATRRLAIAVLSSTPTPRFSLLQAPDVLQDYFPAIREHLLITFGRP